LDFVTELHSDWRFICLLDFCISNGRYLLLTHSFTEN
jgi:hypothetical protein